MFVQAVVVVVVIVVVVAVVVVLVVVEEVEDEVLKVVVVVVVAVVTRDSFECTLLPLGDRARGPAALVAVAVAGFFGAGAMNSVLVLGFRLDRDGDDVDAVAVAVAIAGAVASDRGIVGPVEISRLSTSSRGLLSVVAGTGARVGAGAEAGASAVALSLAHLTC